MEFIHKIEKALEEPFKSLPPLPAGVRKGLADILPWLALVGGALQLLLAWQLFNWANTANDYIDAANRLFASYGVEQINSGLTVWVWAAVITLAVSAIILLVAFPKLQKRLKSGWDLLLLGALINLVYGILSLFIDGRGGVGSLIGALLGSAIGFYLLFQVREHFSGKSAS